MTRPPPRARARHLSSGSLPLREGPGPGVELDAAKLPRDGLEVIRTA